jgi:eukaryotic-like serine/threonine-protein kinase
MGVVYEAIDREQQSRVALKLLPRASADAILQFKNEFRALCDLHHPNLVNLGELISDGERWFFTMELVDGVDLLHYVREGYTDAKSSPRSTAAADPAVATVQLPDDNTATGKGPLRAMAVLRDVRPPHVDRLRAVLAQLAYAVIALHDADKMHRDIKPSNVLVDRHGRVVLLDFGLVRDLVDPNHETQRRIGTPAYMAPELATTTAVGAAADWYSFGVVLYEALTGMRPPTAVERSEGRKLPAIDAAAPADLRALCLDLLAIDPAQRPGDDEVLARLGCARAGSIDTPARFVGRRLELAQLDNAYRRAAAGDCMSVLVAGESGVGKTAFVTHFIAEVRARAPAPLILSGRCYERESVPYKAFDGVIDALAKRLAGLAPATKLPPDAALLVRTFPVLERIPAIASSRQLQDTAEPRELQARVFAALRDLLARLAEQQPLVVVIDDLQWADADSMALLAALLRPPRPPSLLFLATVRTDNAERHGAAVPGEVHHIPLGCLDAAEARELAASLTGGGGDTAAAIANEAAGHPLFIEELARHARDAGEQRERPRLEQALAARIGQLDRSTRHVLELLATAGTPLSMRSLITASEATGESVSRHVARLRGEHLVRTSGSDAEVYLYHDRVRTAVRVGLEPEARRACHQRIAIALETAAAADPAVLALHWRAAGKLEVAAGYAARAAEAASRALAFTRAARFYRLSLVLDPKRPDIAQLRRRLGDALANAGRAAAAARAYRATAAIVDPRTAIELESMAADQLLRNGRIDDGLAVFEHVFRATGLGFPQSPRRVLASLLALRAKLRLRGLGFRERTAGEVDSDALLRIDTCWAAASGMAFVDVVRGSQLMTRALLLALRAGEPFRISRALAAEGAYRASKGGEDDSEAAALIARAEAIARRIDQPNAIAVCGLCWTMNAYLRGRWRETVARAEPTIALIRERCTGAHWELANTRLARHWALIYRGELGELRARIDDELHDAAETGDVFTSSNLRISLCNLAWLARDEPALAEQQLARGMTEWPGRGFQIQHFDEMQSSTHIDLYAGRGARAHERIEAIWPALERSLILYVQQPRIEAWFLRASAALAGQSSLPLARRAARRIARERVLWAAPLADLILAAVAAQEGNADVQEAQLRRAIAGFDTAGMAAHAAAARMRLGALVGGDSGAALSREGCEQLSARGIERPDRWAAMWAPGFAGDH